MTEPSKVIHVRNVGHEISENDLLQLVQPFGHVTKLVMLRAKNQGIFKGTINGKGTTLATPYGLSNIWHFSKCMM